jgi:hypothetical protein
VLTRRDYTGTFEAHITVKTTNLVARERFCLLCKTLGVKCVLIELPQGLTRSQPMTASYHHGTLTSVFCEVQVIAQKLMEAGFEVTRIKIEAMLGNCDVPVTDDEALELPVTNYFEFHVKVILSAIADIKVLQQYCCEHDAHLSANAFKQESDGQQQRFITMRLYNLGKYTAQSRFDLLLTGLKAKGFKFCQQQREYTVYDSNINLDAGWIES